MFNKKGKLSVCLSTWMILPVIGNAADYNNLNITNYLDVKSGETITNSVVDVSGHLNLSDGAVSNILTINNGGIQGVQNNAVATDTTVNSGGLQSVAGSAINTLLDGGRQMISGSADKTTILANGYQGIYSNGIVTNTTINGGTQQLNNGAVATDTVINSGTQNVQGNAQGTTINGGIQSVQVAGLAQNTTINTGGVQAVAGNATGTQINGGEQRISGNADNTTINSDGLQLVYGSGTASNTHIAGGIQSVAGSASETVIDNNGLQIIAAGASATNSTVNDGTINVEEGGSLLGTTQINTNGTLNMQQGTHAAVVNVAGNMVIAPSLSVTPSQVTLTTLNLLNGTLAVSPQAVGTTLVVDQFSSDNGQLVFNTDLGDDRSLTDKLIVNGDTSGSTRVTINNAGGSGAKTLHGIEIIQVNGQSDGEFLQNGRIVAGAYDYRLVRGQESNVKNWYLTTGSSGSDTAPGGNPDSGGGSGAGDDADITDVVPDIRPEAGSYSANLIAANALFLTRFHDRAPARGLRDGVSGERNDTSLWLRQSGGHNNWRGGDGQLKTQSNRYVVQLGSDIARVVGADRSEGILGVMAGYGYNSSNTQARDHMRSKGTVNGYSAGIYASWLQEPRQQTGAYVDSWLQYGWFNNAVNGQDLPEETYRSKGFSASLEAGYAFDVYRFNGSKGTGYAWSLQPQAQAVWMGVKADNHQESNGTRIEGKGNGNVQTRLGARATLRQTSTAENNVVALQPWVELNWIHNSRDYGTQMDAVTVSRQGARDVGDVKAGVSGNVGKNVALWGATGVQLGAHGYHDASVTLGFRYAF